jgi:hypothetical protein
MPSHVVTVTLCLAQGLLQTNLCQPLSSEAAAMHHTTHTSHERLTLSYHC